MEPWRPWRLEMEVLEAPEASLIQTLFSQFSCSNHRWGSHFSAIPCDSVPGVALEIPKGPLEAP